MEKSIKVFFILVEKRERKSNPRKEVDGKAR